MLKDSQILKLRELYAAGVKVETIIKIFGISSKTLYSLTSGLMRRRHFTKRR
jgi:hypothetical protein